MEKRVISRAPVLALGLALIAVSMGLLGAIRSAAAQATNLPQFQVPSPSKFDLTGNINVGPNMSTISATGAISGDLFMQDMTITPANAPALTFNSVQSGMMFYFMLTPSTEWQVIDLSKNPGNVPNIRSNIPGLNGFNPNGGQRTYEAARQATEAGKETVNGTATTRYEAAVDLARLYTSLGTPADQAAQIAAVSSMTLTLWIGDADRNLYRQRVTLNSKAPGAAGTPPLDVLVDFTITYREIGMPVTITVPANAVPYNPQPVPTLPPMPPPPTGPSEVIRAFVDAYNARDADRLRSLVAPGTQFVSDPGTPDEEIGTVEDFTTPPFVTAMVSSVTETGPDTAVAELALSGGDLPPLPNPFTVVVTFKVANGQIVEWVEVVSPQTLRDLEALAASGEQPGMPRTGSGTPLVVVAVAFGLLCLLAGLAARRRYSLK